MECKQIYVIWRVDLNTICKPTRINRMFNDFYKITHGKDC